MSGFGIASQSNDRRVFQQQQHIANLARLAQIDQLSLQAQTFAIINLPELDDRNHVAIEIIVPAIRNGANPPLSFISTPRVPRSCRALCDRAGTLTSYPDHADWSNHRNSRLGAVSAPTPGRGWSRES